MAVRWRKSRRSWNKPLLRVRRRHPPPGRHFLHLAAQRPIASLMGVKLHLHRAARTALLLTCTALACTALACCGRTPEPKLASGATSPQTRTDQGDAVAAMAQRDCPAPPGLESYEQTTLSQRTRETISANLAVFGSVKSGCAIMTFTVNETGLVTSSKTWSASSPAFAAIAPKLLRWSNYASGDSNDVEFFMRLGASRLPGGGAMLSLGFKGSTVNLEIPP
jgi:hypothetical protein